MSGDVLYYSDASDLAGELATAAKTITSVRGGRAIDLEMDQARESVHADSAIVVRSGQPISTNPELVANGIASVASQLKPSVILIG